MDDLGITLTENNLPLQNWKRFWKIVVSMDYFSRWPWLQLCCNRYRVEIVDRNFSQYETVFAIGSHFKTCFQSFAVKTNFRVVQWWVRLWDTWCTVVYTLVHSLISSCNIKFYAIIALCVWKSIVSICFLILFLIDLNIISTFKSRLCLRRMRTKSPGEKVCNEVRVLALLRDKQRLAPFRASRLSRSAVGLVQPTPWLTNSGLAIFRSCR